MKYLFCGGGFCFDYLEKTMKRKRPGITGPCS